MEKKFKCQSCGHEFVADTNQYVTCPKCDSDNIALVKSSGSALKIILIAGGALIVIAGIVAAIMILKNDKADKPTPPVPPDPAPVDTVVTEEKVIEQIEESMPEGIEFTATGTPAYKEADETYSVTVAARVRGANAGDYSLSYTIADFTTGKAIATNTTGTFAGLRPIAASVNNPESSYTVTARAMHGSQCVDSISTSIPGFRVVERNIVKMTVAEVQALIDNHSTAALAGNQRLAETIAVTCQGDTGGNPAPRTLSKLIKDISMGIYSGARVVSLGYDSHNRVNSVTVTLTTE